MAKNFLLLLLLLGLMTRVASSASTIPNQAWWASLTPRERNAATVAMVSGYAVGYNDGLQTAGNQTLRFSRSPEAYIMGIDGFYVKHPNLAGVGAAAILPCLADNPTESCDNRALFLSGK